MLNPALNNIKRIISAVILMTFSISGVVPPQFAYAQAVPQTVLNLPVAGTMVNLTPAFNPVMIKGVNLYPDNPLKFDFIIDKGETNLDDEAFKKESTKLIKYFLASLTVPEDQMWVNLSPYEKNRIVPDDFGKTEMGRDLLTQDYMLKQLTASLMYPEKELGGEFWKRIYSQTQEKYGTTDIPMNTFNKIWIVPEKAVVYEHEKGAFVVKSHLKVMLEEDYLALEANKNSTKHGAVGVQNLEPVQSGISSEIVREILIPEIEKEVNEGKTFANLRQIYNAVILGSWYKQALKESILGQVYVDQKKTKGVEVEDKSLNEQIYNQYVESFKKGVYDYIKEDIDPKTQEIIPRKYFSGGIQVDMSQLITERTLNPSDAAIFATTVVTTEVTSADAAVVSASTTLPETFRMFRSLVERLEEALLLKTGKKLPLWVYEALISKAFIQINIAPFYEWSRMFDNPTFEEGHFKDPYYPKGIPIHETDKHLATENLIKASLKSYYLWSIPIGLYIGNLVGLDNTTNLLLHSLWAPYTFKAGQKVEQDRQLNKPRDKLEIITSLYWALPALIYHWFSNGFMHNIPNKFIPFVKNRFIRNKEMTGLIEKKSLDKIDSRLWGQLFDEEAIFPIFDFLPDRAYVLGLPKATKDKIAKLNLEEGVQRDVEEIFAQGAFSPKDRMTTKEFFENLPVIAKLWKDMILNVKAPSGDTAVLSSPMRSLLRRWSATIGIALLFQTPSFVMPPVANSAVLGIFQSQGDRIVNELKQEVEKFSYIPPEKSFSIAEKIDSILPELKGLKDDLKNGESPESVTRKLYNLIKGKFKFDSEEKADIESVLANKKGNCIGGTQLFYTAGRSIGLDVQPIEVMRTSDGYEIFHVANSVQISPGKYLTVDTLIDDVGVGATFNMDETYFQNGIYLRVKGSSDTVHQEIRFIGANGLTAYVYLHTSFKKPEYAFALDPQNVWAHLKLGEDRVSTKFYSRDELKGLTEEKFLDVERRYKEALALNPNFSAAYGHLSDLYFYNNRPREALSFVTKEIEYIESLIPEEVRTQGYRTLPIGYGSRPQRLSELYYQRTSIYDQLGMVKEAQADLDRQALLSAEYFSGRNLTNPQLIRYSFRITNQLAIKFNTKFSVFINPIKIPAAFEDFYVTLTVAIAKEPDDKILRQHPQYPNDPITNNSKIIKRAMGEILYPDTSKGGKLLDRVQAILRQLTPKSEDPRVDGVMRGLQKLEKDNALLSEFKNKLLLSVFSAVVMASAVESVQAQVTGTVETHNTYERFFVRNGFTTLSAEELVRRIIDDVRRKNNVDVVINEEQMNELVKELLNTNPKALLINDFMPPLQSFHVDPVFNLVNLFTALQEAEIYAVQTHTVFGKPVDVYFIDDTKFNDLNESVAIALGDKIVIKVSEVFRVADRIRRKDKDSSEDGRHSYKFFDEIIKGLSDENIIEAILTYTMAHELGHSSSLIFYSHNPEIDRRLTQKIPGVYPEDTGLRIGVFQESIGIILGIIKSSNTKLSFMQEIFMDLVVNLGFPNINDPHVIARKWHFPEILSRLGFKEFLIKKKIDQQRKSNNLTEKTEQEIRDEIDEIPLSEYFSGQYLKEIKEFVESLDSEFLDEIMRNYFVEFFEMEIPEFDLKAPAEIKALLPQRNQGSSTSGIKNSWRSIDETNIVVGQVSGKPIVYNGSNNTAYVLNPKKESAPGGIDLNPTILNTEIKRTGRGVIIPTLKGPMPDLKNVEGFVPNIINVTPISNLHFLLGIKDQNPQEKESTEVSYNLSSLPIELRNEFK